METEKLYPGSKFYYGYIIVLASTLTMVGAFGIHYAFGVFFKPLLADFGWSRAITSGAVSLSWIIQGLSAIAMGWLNDRRGPRVVLSISGLTLGLGYLLMAQVNDLWQLYLFYGGLVGAGLGGIYVPLTSTVARWFAVRRSLMTGIVVSGIGIGTLIAPLVANWLISAYDWRFSYQILGALVLVIVITAAQFLKREPSIERISQFKSSRAETDVKGMLFKDAIRVRQFWMIFSLFFCFGIGLYVVLVHIVPFATDLDIKATTAAGLLSTIGGVSIAGKVIFGRIGDRIGSRSIYIVCFILMALAFFLLIKAEGIWMLYIFAVVFGLAYAGCAAAQSPMVAKFFGLRAHGAIFGVVNSSFTLGAAVGPIMAGYIFDISQSYKWAFIISAAVALAGLAFTLVLKPIQDKAVSINPFRTNP